MLRRIISVLPVMVFTLALAVSGAVFADPSPGKTLVGAWEVTIISDLLPPAIDTSIVHRDGSMSNWDPSLGTGNGIWRRLGVSRYETKFKTLVLFNNVFGLSPWSTLTVTAEVEVDKDGKSASGPFTANLEPDGQNFTDFAGTVFLSRMTFDE